MFGFKKQDDNKPNAEQQQQDTNKPQDEPKTGVDKFAFLLENNDQAKNEDKGKAQPINPKELFANKEFTDSLRQNARANALSSLSDEVKQGIVDGNPESLIEALGSMSEAIYMQAIQDTSNLQSVVLDQKLDTVKDDAQATVNSGLREHQITQAIPQLKNPILRLGVQSFMDKLQEQDPTMSPEDMKEQVGEYLSTLGKEFGVVAEDVPEESDTDQGVDWMEELGLTEPSQT